MLMCVFLFTFAHETAGAARTRSSLGPDLWANDLQNSGEVCRENAKVCLSFRRPGEGRDPYAVSLRLKPRRCNTCLQP
jgi:hypothetical protein